MNSALGAERDLKDRRGASGETVGVETADNAPSPDGTERWAGETRLKA